MSGYTDYLADALTDITPEEENYREKLMELVRHFRSFGDSLTEFVSERGYTGAPEDTAAKVAFIRGRFESAGMEPPRFLPDWFTGGKEMNRETAFSFCFAFGLNLAETNDFFRRVCLRRGFDCHSHRELVYYYCIQNGLPRSAAEEILSQIPAIPSGGVLPGSDVLYTESILTALGGISTAEDLRKFILENRQQFAYNNATATKYIRGLWQSIGGSEGIAARERARWEEFFGNPEESGKSAGVYSDWDVYLQILVADRELTDRLSGDRTLKPILRNNALLHRAAGDSFPDREGINKLMNGRHVSNETVRKTLILLAFYRFWAERALSRPDGEYMYCAVGEDGERAVYEINNFLVTAGYPELYSGNPYDWIFLWSCQDAEPLGMFRLFMGELLAEKSECD